MEKVECPGRDFVLGVKVLRTFLIAVNELFCIVFLLDFLSSEGEQAFLNTLKQLAKDREEALSWKQGKVVFKNYNNDKTSGDKPVKSAGSFVDLDQ